MTGRGGDTEKPNVAGDANGASTHPSIVPVPVTSTHPPPKPPAQPEAPESHGRERRSSERIDVTWSVDCETEDTFLYAAITNISEMGIFVRTTAPLAVGTLVTLRFAPPHSGEPFILGGVVQWVNAVRPLHDNPNPGMGIRFSSLTLPDRERIVDVIHTIAYLRDDPRAARN